MDSRGWLAKFIQKISVLQRFSRSFPTQLNRERNKENRDRGQSYQGLSTPSLIVALLSERESRPASPLLDRQTLRLQMVERKQFGRLFPPSSLFSHHRRRRDAHSHPLAILA